ncbi:hypothetical protein M378DRAFT_70408 [Amanita muscaria Koide BX008]|uniref:Uncharacterized protein n=1 Tax=Amanita muscaria (strain Koide BX008) TaxID=946122 RepID=A0A0C2TNS7_AMAMK|nr:hypothetical protein M378DRAFT_70408 [Amanita muscaria Koide BX008]
MFDLLHLISTRWTREQLLNSLQMLQNLPDPLPATLPPSPPASRSASPAPPSKRKSEQSSEPDHVKRPRTSAIPDRPQPSQHQHHHPPQSQPPTYHHTAYHSQPTPLHVPPIQHRSSEHYYNARTEPCEDGEVREDLVPPRVPSEGSDPVPQHLPVRRPRRGKGPQSYWDMLHDKYHSAGRMLKYSGDARFWSTYPTTHREYRPLPDPPLPGSPYHKHGGLIARLELVDALVCFTYSLWSRDYSRNSCNNETWATIEAFLGWCRDKWQAEEGTNDAEKAFLGLIFMIEAFIRARKMAYAAKGSDHSAMEVYNNMKAKVISAAIKAEEESVAGNAAAKQQTTPPMLPSPASIGPANSANSTPTNREDATPSAASGRSASAAPPAPRRPVKASDYPIPLPLVPDRYKGVNTVPPISKSVSDAMAAVTVPVGAAFVNKHKEIVIELTAAHYCMVQSQVTLTLPTMARHFPNTFARMVYTTLLPSEEHEPEFEDEEGELFWPGQCITGEGLGWVCLMSKAMIKEFGKAYGYRGLDGVVHKPEQNSDRSNKPPPPPPTQNTNHHHRLESTYPFNKATTGTFNGSSLPVQR